MKSAKKCEIKNVNVHSKKCFDVFSGIGKKLSIKYKGKRYQGKNKQYKKNWQNNMKAHQKQFIYSNLFT